MLPVRDAKQRLKASLQYASLSKFVRTDKHVLPFMTLHQRVDN
jgi:hypothetical protein